MGKCHLFVTVPISILMPMHGHKECASVALDNNSYLYAPKVIWRLVGATFMNMIFVEVFELQVKAISFNECHRTVSLWM